MRQGISGTTRVLQETLTSGATPHSAAYSQNASGPVSLDGGASGRHRRGFGFIRLAPSNIPKGCIVLGLQRSDDSLGLDCSDTEALENVAAEAQHAFR